MTAQKRGASKIQKDLYGTKMKIDHRLEPIYDRTSTILILGTMPSPKSREAGFYYAHPQNKLWRVLAAVFGQEVPASNQEKEYFLLANHIAMWDVLESCLIKGADDSSIQEPVPNDLGRILNAAPISAIFTTGMKATQLYRKLCEPTTGRPAIGLPSTSPANCRNHSLDTLIEAYRVILDPVRPELARSRS